MFKLQFQRRRDSDSGGENLSFDDPLFKSLARGSNATVRCSDLVELLSSVGLDRKDKRLATFFERLDSIKSKMNFQEFKYLLSANEVLIRRALMRNLIVPDWSTFSTIIEEIFHEVELEKGGSVASYIPQLAAVDPEKYAVSVCSVDGQRLSLGDAGDKFCIQSCVKPFLYLMALNEQGAGAVHHRVGREPSGQSFNKLTLKEVDPTQEIVKGAMNDNHDDPVQIPHNPMINSGAILCSSLIIPHETRSERLKLIMSSLGDMSGDEMLSYCHDTFMSEQDTADRNRSIAYMMRENKAFPTDTDVNETLRLYFQACSIKVTCDNMATMAATLANGGTCPITNKNIFEAGHVRNSLALMLSCGMYDYSGEWAFQIGLPAKSGVGGAILIVIPNKMGICIWGPRIDKMGNSVRGVTFAKRLIERFNFHHLDNLSGMLTTGSKVDPCARPSADDQYDIALLFAASRGDLSEVMRLASLGFNLFLADYDDRTALHVAASSGHYDVVEYLIYDADGNYIDDAKLNAPDRFHNTPTDGAFHSGNMELYEMMKAAGGIHNKTCAD